MNANQGNSSTPQTGWHGHLIEPGDGRRVLTLIHLLLLAQQCVLAVPTAADALVFLLIEHGAHTAHTANAATARAMYTARRLAGAGVGAQGVSAGTGELICKHRGHPSLHHPCHMWVSGRELGGYRDQAPQAPSCREIPRAPPEWPSALFTAIPGLTTWSLPSIAQLTVNIFWANCLPSGCLLSV